MLQAIIFDVGGVLLRTHDWGGRYRWDERLGLPHGRVEYTFFNSDLGLAAQHGRVSLEQHWQNVAERLGVPLAELPQLRADFWAGDVWDEGLLGLIRRLHGRGYLLGIISNAPDDLRDVLTHKVAIAPYFHTITISAEEGMMKPEPAIYTRTLARLGVAAEEAVFIDDSPTNIAGGEAVGLRGVLYQAGMDVTAVLAELGV
jgi:glucose-1-phosphatase